MISSMTRLANSSCGTTVLFYDLGLFHQPFVFLGVNSPIILELGVGDEPEERQQSDTKGQPFVQKIGVLSPMICVHRAPNPGRIPTGKTVNVWAILPKRFIHCALLLVSYDSTTGMSMGKKCGRLGTWPFPRL